MPQTPYNTRCCWWAIERYGVTERFCRMKVFASRLAYHLNEVNTSKHRKPRTISDVIWKLSNEISVCFSEDFCIFFGFDRRKNAQKWPKSDLGLWYNLIQFLRFGYNSQRCQSGVNKTKTYDSTRRLRRRVMCDVTGAVSNGLSFYTSRSLVFYSV